MSNLELKGPIYIQDIKLKKLSSLIFLLKLSYDFTQLNERYHQLLNDTIGLLFFDRIHFIQYAAFIHECSHSRLACKHLNKLQYLIYKKFSRFANPNMGQNVLNLSSVQFSVLELAILLHGLEFCIPPS